MIRMALNQRSTCFCLPSNGSKGECHHCPVLLSAFLSCKPHNKPISSYAILEHQYPAAPNLSTPFPKTSPQRLFPRDQFHHSEKSISWYQIFFTSYFSSCYDKIPGRTDFKMVCLGHGLKYCSSGWGSLKRLVTSKVQAENRWISDNVSPILFLFVQPWISAHEMNT